MKTRIKQIIANPLFSGSAVMILGSNVGNALAYLYHVVIGRMLGPSSYGEFSSILSLLGLLFTSFTFMGLVIVKFISAAKEEEIPYIFGWFSKKMLKVGIAVGLTITLFSVFISKFLHVHLNIALLLGPIAFFAFLAFVYRSFAQGLMKFGSIVIALNLDLIVRLVVGVILILLGYSVFGVVFGIVISELVVFIYLKKVTNKYTIGGKKLEIKLGDKVKKYALPLLVGTLATNSMFSTDVLLVKHFFTAHDAGIYASLSTLGRIIFYGTGPVAGVMFPMIAKRYSEGKGSNMIFYLSLLLTLAIAGTILLIFYLLPELSIRILFGEKYIEGASYLVKFGLFMTIFATASLVFNYFLSIEKTIVVYISVLASIAQAIGIYFWHGNFTQVLNTSIYSSLFFLIALLFYYRYHTSNESRLPKE